MNLADTYPKWVSFTSRWTVFICLYVVSVELNWHNLLTKSNKKNILFYIFSILLTDGDPILFQIKLKSKELIRKKHYKTFTLL